MADSQTKRRRRVLIIESHTLMTDGLRRLLADEASLDVTGAPFITQARLVQDIQNTRPDIVLFDSNAAQAIVAALTDFRFNGAVLLAVEMSADHTTALRYERRPVEITSIADLLAVIMAT